MGGVALALLLCVPLTAACGAVNFARPVSRTPGSTLTIAVMGASDAWGIGTHDPDRINWPSLMTADLPQPNHLINLGAPGSTLAQARRDELPVVLGEHPDVVVIWLAINDIIDDVPLDAYSSEVRQTLTAIHQQSPHTRVFVGNVPDLTQIPYFAGQDQERLRAKVTAWNAAIAQACQSPGVTLVDLYAVWGQLSEHPDYISDDGLHPSDRGAEALASVFSAAIDVTLRGAA